MNLEIEGIVLRQIPYKEKDRILTIITREGLVSFNARGIASLTSKNSSSCNLFCYSNFFLNKTNDKCSLKQGKIIDSNYEIYNSLEKLSAIQLASEAIIRFMDPENKRIYYYFYKLIEELKNDFDSKTLLVIFLAQIIKDSGYGLEYSSCIGCGNKNDIVEINYEIGGFLCSNCAKKANKSIDNQEYLKSFRYSFMVTPDLMSHYELNDTIARRLLNEYITYLTTNFDIKEFKSFDIYKNSLI